MKLVTKGDKIVILAAAMFAALAYFVFNFTIFASRPQQAEVFVDGKPYASYDLSEAYETKLVEIETKFGSNTLEIASDGVRVTDASCPDKNDLKVGKITKANQMIICVPNRFSVKLTGSGAEVDRVTH